jgi:magnesium-transporting ATPase (P-type)
MWQLIQSLVHGNVKLARMKMMIQLLLHEQIIPYPQMSKMQCFSLFVDDAPWTGKQMLWFVKGVKFLPTRQM